MVKSSFTIFFITIFTTMISGSNRGLPEFANRQWTPPKGYNQVVCRSIDARNTVDTLRKLQNCTIIIGCLQMVLINNVPVDINDMSFPMLREVTDYIYLYQVKGLRTLSNLFPNLEVIGGRELLRNYALVIDQVSELEEVGLYNLKTIRNGLVRIDNNPKACYLKTINWDKITNRPGNLIIQYAACKHQDICEHCAGEHCWNEKSCQILPPITKETKTCDAKCLTCSVNNKTLCYKCRYYSGEYLCLAACDGDRVTLKIFNTSYCLTTQQCLALYGFVARGVCFLYCPTPESRKLYEIDILLPLIRDRCSTVCPSLTINSLGDLQKAVNCKEIKGSLQIRLFGDYDVITMDDLRHNLRSVEVIRDYLKIFNSNIVTSLSFLENLKLIQGKHLDMSTYSIVIHDMINLRLLFTEGGTNNLKIEAGDILAFNNPKLCMDDIKKLHRNKVPKAEQIAYTSNGYSVMCHKKEIKPSHTDITFDRITITFSRVTPANQRKKYKLHLLQSDQKTSEDFFKTCQKIGWRTYTIDDVNPKTLNITFKLFGLQELAYYTYYIESVSVYDNFTHVTDDMTINKSHSHIITFQTTLKSIPPPLIVNMSSLAPNSLYVQWKDNLRQANLVQFYVFQLELIKDSLNIYDGINFCRRPTMNHYVNEKLHTEYQYFMENRCKTTECGKDIKTVKFDILKIVNTFDMDNQPEIYVKSKFVYKSLNVTNKRMFYRTVLDAPTNNITVKGLFDYGYYKIKIYACSLVNCSQAATSAKRIMQSHDADNIEVNGHISENKNLNLFWQEPTMPNGVIISYLVEFLQASMGISEPINSYVPLRFCITRKDHQLNNYTFVIPHVSDVKCNVRIAAISLAGVGRFSNYSLSGPSAAYHIVLWPISFVFLISLCGLAFLYVRRRRQRRAHSEFRNPLIRTNSETN